MEMNMNSIPRKSEVAKDTANKAVFWIVITLIFYFLIAFDLLINLPSKIANHYPGNDGYYKPDCSQKLLETRSF